MRKKATHTIAWLAALGASGCMKASEPAPASPGSVREQQQQPSQAGAPAPAPMAAPAAPAATAPPDAEMPGARPVPHKEVDRDKKKADEVTEAARMIDDAFATLTKNDAELTRLSSTACGDACRALASMERAVRTVCDLVSPEERGRCDDAAGRLRNARKRVRDACGTCAAGPSTDPDAPLR